MNNGVNYTHIVLESLTLKINGPHCVLRNVLPVTLYVKYYYEEAIPPTEDEPPSDEYVEVLDVTVLVPTYFTNNSGVSLSVDGRATVIDLLTEKQIEDIMSRIKHRG